MQQGPRNIFLLSLLLVFPTSAWADEHGETYRSKYAGQEAREIKSLSRDDIEELESGAGWGLAKAAELNGLPGPRHLLEMKKELGLSLEQEEKVAALYAEMKEKATVLGEQLIQAERELDRRFADRTIDEASLDRLLTRISETYKSLRFVHLAAHLKTPGIISAEQVTTYNRLRGYDAADPCSRVPEGHDPVMWRRHNNCE